MREEYSGEQNDDGRAHGKGRWEFANGGWYEGDFKRGKRHGSGVMQYGDTGDRYAGGWANGQRHGWGTMVCGASGVRTSGWWRRGRMVPAAGVRGSADVMRARSVVCTVCGGKQVGEAEWEEHIRGHAHRCAAATLTADDAASVGCPSLCPSLGDEGVVGSVLSFVQPGRWGVAGMALQRVLSDADAPTDGRASPAPAPAATARPAGRTRVLLALQRQALGEGLLDDVMQYL
eukprot:TRINITY_DN37008_c0_g1_i1.p1 TRINITY_DN37008_c0_g1~~TRINITY_DN37008_c0_g1_i1.p1  ORF type:complete len:241 (+),score=50.58 TRINITY_DN37008_c0_g1_i1:29-724(+)